MERETYFADILLPLPLPANFTYRIPFKFNELVEVGKRVVVQFGAKKLYSGIIVSIHQVVPNYQNIKYILNVLDEKPSVNPIQLKFWQWISQYYMCHQGEVLNAALPSALKLASESKLVLHPDFDGNYDQLNDKEFMIMQALELNVCITFTEVSQIIEQQKIMPLLKGLIEKKCVLPEEEIKDRFKPKTEAYIRLASEYLEDEKLQLLTQELEKKAFKQLELLVAFLQYSNHFSGDLEEVSKVFLLKKSNISATILTALSQKGVLEIYHKNESRLIDVAASKNVADLQLSEKQNQALAEINEILKSQDTCLIHGVTGSGKTEIYIKLIDEYLSKGKQVLFLIPEIALTAQLINRLRKYFGNDLGYYHSKYGNNERVEVWHRMLEGEQKEYKVIIGARSSMFLPYRNLGLIIIDEEHDPSYKQYDPAPRYNARDAAMVLANMHQAKCLLGSATPSLESYYSAKSGKYGLVELKERYSKVNMPEILVADITDARKKKEMKSHFTSFLLEHIKEALSKNEQVILFQNRRGFSLRLVCDDCQWSPGCNNCDVGLTYHKHQARMRCHYCGHAKDIPTQCPECGSKKLTMKGFGTEKIEEEIPVFFPDAVVKRMDLDTTRSKNAYFQILNDFEDRKIDVLVGTQMVSKGLDFDHVSLVGVMNADNMLHYPDFRSFERSFQQMVQVSGRSGRKHKRGKVVIQTAQPYHAVIQNVMENNYEAMYKSQMEERANFKYPPFYRIIKITLKHRDYHVLNDGANFFIDLLRPKLGSRVLGPEYPAVARIKNLYLKNILVKFESKASHLTVKAIIKEAMDSLYLNEKFRSIMVIPDVDPQ